MLSFWDWPSSLSLTPSRRLRAVTNEEVSFLFMSEERSMVRANQLPVAASLAPRPWLL